MNRDSASMPRPRLNRVTCHLRTVRQNADGSISFYYRVCEPALGGGRTRRNASVPRHVASRKRDKNKALRWIAQEEARLNADRAAGVREGVTLAEAVRRFVAYKEKRTRPGTVREYRGILNGLRGEVGADTPVREITPGDIERYVDGQDLAAATANKYRRHLKAFGGWLVRHGLLRANPAAALEPEREIRRRKATPNDADAARIVLKCLDLEPVRGLAVWAQAETGCRISEVLCRRWSDLTFFREADEQHPDGVVLTGAALVLPAEETKAGKPRVPPAFSRELAERLWQYRRELEAGGYPDAYVFLPWTRSGRGRWRTGAEAVEADGGRWWQNTPMHEARKIRRLLENVCAALDLPKITTHAFRRTFSTAGADLDIREMDMLAAGGWSSAAVRDGHYTTSEALTRQAVRTARRIADRRGFGRLVSAAEEEQDSWAESGQKPRKGEPASAERKP